MSYLGPGEIIGIGVLILVLLLLLVLFMAFRKEVSFSKAPNTLGQGVMGVSTVSTETSYMLQKTGMGADGIEFKAIRVCGSPGAGGSSYGDGVGTSAPPQVMVRPIAHSPLPGHLGNQESRSVDGDKTTSSEGSQVCVCVCLYVLMMYLWDVCMSVCV